MLPDDQYEGAILYLETSEELPPADFVYRVLMCMGERGLLQRFAAVLWARPKAWNFEQPNTAAEKARYTTGQREAVPSGGEVTVDAASRQIHVTY